MFSNFWSQNIGFFLPFNFSPEGEVKVTWSPGESWGDVGEVGERGDLGVQGEVVNVGERGGGSPEEEGEEDADYDGEAAG